MTKLAHASSPLPPGGDPINADTRSCRGATQDASAMASGAWGSIRTFTRFPGLYRFA